MTYRQLLYKAQRLINHNEITLGEYDEMTKPLEEEIRKVGKWTKECDTEFGSIYICSVCGRSVVTYGIDNKSLSDYPYCHCGAQMEGGENG